MTSALSPTRRAQSAPAAVANRNPDRSRTKYEGNATPKSRNRSGCTASSPGYSSDSPRARSARCAPGGSSRPPRPRAARSGAGGGVRSAAAGSPACGYHGYGSGTGSPDCAGGTSDARRTRRPSALAREHVDGHEPHADADGDVGHVERGPVVARPTCASMKSMTWPYRMRSNTFPSAPPSTSGSPHCSARWCGCSRRYSVMMNAMAATETSRKNGRRTFSLVDWSRPHAPPRFLARMSARWFFQTSTIPG